MQMKALELVDWLTLINVFLIWYTYQKNAKASFLNTTALQIAHFLKLSENEWKNAFLASISRDQIKERQDKCLVKN